MYFFRRKGGEIAIKEEIKLILNKLDGHNIRVTSTRKRIIECFFANRNRHMNSEEILEWVRKKRPGTGIATIYRNLDLLGKYGIINKIEDDNRSYYELKQFSKKSTHFHIKCKGCGKLIDVVDRDFEVMFLQFKLKMEKKYNCIIDDARIIMEGKCHNCCEAIQ